MPPQMNRGQLMMFIIFLIFMLPSAPSEDAGFPATIQKKQILENMKEEMRQSRDILVNSTYAEGYGNLTGFRLSYKDAVIGRNESDWPFDDRVGEKFTENQQLSILPDIVSNLAKKIWNSEGKVISDDYDGLEKRESVLDINESKKGFWFNVTGTLRGEFENYQETKLVPIPMPIPWYYKNLTDYDEVNRQVDPFDPSTDSSSATFDSTLAAYAIPADRVGNVTDPNGNFKISLQNYNITDLESESTLISMSIRVKDPEEKKDHNLHMSGIYYPKTGNILTTTRSAKFAGIYALPHLALQGGEIYNETQQLITASNLRTNIDELGFERVESLLDMSAKCEYISYLHLESVNLTPDELKEIDDELQRPIGRPHADIPNLKISSGLMYSPDCGILLNLQTAVGPREEVYEKYLQKVVIVSAILITAQILLGIKQMNATSTPSTISRISLYTISIFNIVDGSICLIALGYSILYSSLYKQFSVCGFLIFTCSSIFEMKYMISIYASQMSERTINWRTALQGTPIDDRENANNNDAANGTIPVTVVQPVAEQDEQTISGQLHVRFFFSMIAFSFLIANVVLWPKKQRHVFEYLCGFVIYSCWIPQIYRNVIRGSRKSFRWDFMLGTTIIRFIPVIYVDLFDNPFYHHKEKKMVIVFGIWLSIQLFVMWLQELFGARFFLPEKYLPKTYDYHPVLSFDDLENGFSVEHNQTNHRHSKCKIDCAICMNSFEVPVSNTHDISNRADGESLGPEHTVANAAFNLMARRAYMVTPCRHIFHTECLENWMKYKLQCPVCRNSLPPL
ncbi:hypothetical protein CANARDRAFT_27994 [[Candida] arabinofermentans NRRL YB-2248]|uniref:RING-type E3 ubiquitin transferase n=1 Tax=[Candida] arabinofermentans NRRL YB-2248 TaxID=983967 RepID=A0A1E4T2E9_9ASCO|nr:hypothetical protein CANARDRAFT_27994 [[Candida] arabinofermentans NRRL YB-2248]